MTLTIILCAMMCAGVCLWTFKSVQSPRVFMHLALLVACASLGIYMVLGNPDIPARPTQGTAQTQADMRLESTLMATLEKNPKDKDALIRLAALRVAQGRGDEQTVKLLDQAEKIDANDRRIKLIRAMLEKISQ